MRGRTPRRPIIIEIAPGLLGLAISALSGAVVGFLVGLILGQMA